MKLKSLILCGLAFASLNAAQAVEVTISGTSLGAFNAAPFSSPATLGGLSFSGITGPGFTETTVGGIAAIDVGEFSLNSTNFTYTGNDFHLQITFTAPTGIVPGGAQTFTADLLGQVNNLGEGGVFIDFNNTPQLFTFNTGAMAGSFLFFVNDVSVQPGLTADLTSTVLAASQSVPDGGLTVALLGLALVGVEGIRRKLGVSLLTA